MIKIQNIYYMLTYVFRILQKQQYKSCAVEKFENTEELLSAILAMGVSSQIKRGLKRTYVEQIENTDCPRGKIDIAASIKNRASAQQKLFCVCDEFLENAYLNRILKTTICILLKSEISQQRKHDLRKLMWYFRNIDILDISSINWKIQYNRNDRTYEMLISICWLIVKGMLQTTQDGSLKIIHFNEKSMAYIYEKFILEYYRREYPQLAAAPSRIEWAVDDGNFALLPEMRSDITLSCKNHALIIDAKYYESHSLQKHYDIYTQHSQNLYQIFTYVKNKAAMGYCTSGLILYAKTDEQIQPDQRYRLSGSQIDIRALDLNCEFSKIKAQLNEIADGFIKEAAKREAISAENQ